jgi:hypothetical protein
MTVLTKSYKPPPRPRQPSRELAVVVAFAAVLLAPLAKGEIPHYAQIGVGCLAALLAFLRWRDEWRAYSRDFFEWRIHNTEWQLRQSRDWLAYFEKRKENGAPWYNEDPETSMQQAYLGAITWNNKVQLLERELQELLKESQLREEAAAGAGRAGKPQAGDALVP